MRQGYFTTFKPDVKLPTLGMILASMWADQMISVHVQATEEAIVNRTRAGAVPVQKVLRYLDCSVINIVYLDDVINIVIVYGGGR